MMPAEIRRQQFHHAAGTPVEESKPHDETVGEKGCLIWAVAKTLVIC